jgi:hypothetical protein
MYQAKVPFKGTVARDGFEHSNLSTLRYKSRISKFFGFGSKLVEIFQAFFAVLRIFQIRREQFLS